MASPKGGAGKSTAAIILATEFSLKGIPVTIMDCDPNQCLSLWYEKSQHSRKNQINKITVDTPQSLKQAIKTHDRDGCALIIDLEGLASNMTSNAISQADLVIIPMRPTPIDATIGRRIISLMAKLEPAIQRKIHHAVVFTMTRMVRTKYQRALQKDLEYDGIHVIEPPLTERTAFAAMFEDGESLRDMPQNNGNLAAAIQNAEAFAMAVYNLLTQPKQVEA